MNAHSNLAQRIARRSWEQTIGVLADRLYTLERSVDISEEGMQILCHRLLPQDKNVLVNFWLEKIGCVILPAQVQWIKPAKDGTSYLSGLMFLKMPFETRRALRTFIAQSPIHLPSLKPEKTDER